jgi:hypothetical protein
MATSSDLDALCRDCVFPMRNSLPRLALGGQDTPFPLGATLTDPDTVFPLSFIGGGDNVFPMSFPPRPDVQFGTADHISSAILVPIPDVPGGYTLVVDGMFSGDGWTHAVLLERTYPGDVPPDGMLEFFLCATRSTFSHEKTSSVRGVSDLVAQAGFKGVRINFHTDVMLPVVG